MGLCICRDWILKKRDSVSSQRDLDNDHPRSTRDPQLESQLRRSLRIHRNAFRAMRSNAMLPEGDHVIDHLVLDTPNMIRTYLDFGTQLPPSMIRIHAFAETERGWIYVIKSMIKNIPIENPLGSAAILLLLDECPIPTKESVNKLTSRLNLKNSSIKSSKALIRHRNICVMLGSLAERLAGPNSIAILTPTVLKYLLSNLNTKNNPLIILFSLIALEKFAQTSENKLTIHKRIQSLPENPLLILEKWIDDPDYDRQQVGFCAQWSLDNIFIHEDRPFSYENVDRKNLNVLLNANDVSEYLKISPNGLIARCDSASFESVRCTFQVDEGIWYYEVTIITSGVMQIGFATKSSRFLNHEGHGIGDDEYSIAYDGCRQLIWHEAHPYQFKHGSWKQGDILGCLLDLVNLKIIFSLNGVAMPPVNHVFQNAVKGFFAGASLMSFQECIFNFGREPFKYPPSGINFKCFNDYANPTEEEKIIYPRFIILKNLHKSSLRDDCCTLCCENVADIMLLPCRHDGFCFKCANMLELCPMCRLCIDERVQQESAVAEEDDSNEAMNPEHNDTSTPIEQDLH
ncbi:RING finger and SPRY domain-containing protein 1 [Tetranychus urticae]|uniref:RING-type domain-containing protein n=1 Tax=Tetranychus urticae TaxID=32264 RepID=T1KY72_TETUR|nr:RING finger and SPRY domain-containing protein 1 [Tetranychus urticae]